MNSTPFFRATLEGEPICDWVQNWAAVADFLVNNNLATYAHRTLFQILPGVNIEMEF